MGFFAITNRRVPAKFTIEACHLCFWVLRKSWFRAFRHSYLFDVGIRVRPQEELRRIRIALPFDTQKGDLVDLSAHVLDSDFSELIFGRPVKVEGEHVIYDGKSIGQDSINDRVISVSTKDSEPEAETEKDINFTTWTIQFAEPARANEDIYIRFRFPVRDPSRIWVSKGWGLAKRGVVADFRVADVRESVLLGRGRAEANHIQPIKKLFLFLIAPSQYVPKHVSPALHYSRILEPLVWSNYLKSCGGYDEATKLTIHQWRSADRGKATDPISAQNPFRAYADLTREFGPEIFLYYVAGGMLLPVLTWFSEWVLFPLLTDIIGWFCQHIFNAFSK